VAQVLSTYCTACHSDPPAPGALAGLVTYTDLMATSHEDPTKNEAQLSLSRMQDTSKPMPPTGLPPAADVTTFQTWVNGGYPKGTCGGSSGSSSGGGSGSGSGTQGGDGGSSVAVGLPCDVAAVFANCTACHSDPPLASALAGLVTYSDLMATSHLDATKNEAQESLALMQNASLPMPPSGLPPASDVTTLQNWVNAGYPMGSCADAGSPPPTVNVFNNTPPFASHTGPSTHNAGMDCLNCHGSSAGCTGGGDCAPLFGFGGTLYDGSGNPVAGAEVRLVDANGNGTSVYTGPEGTFYGSASFVGPAHVGARNATSTQEMLTALQSGSQPPATSGGGGCSGCHCTGTGCTIAPIHLP
jgi:hypothetical protein